MRFFIVLLSLCLALSPAFAGSRDEAALRIAAQQLDGALQQKDTALLDILLSEKLQYGHSNGWIETKQDVKADLLNGKIVYQSIRENEKGLQVVIEGNTGLVREDIAIEVLLDGKPVSLNLSVLQVWVLEKGNWKLIARQSTKVEKH